MKWGKRGRYNTEWADFRSRGRRPSGLPKELASPADLDATYTAKAAWPYQPAITLFLHGPEIAGPNLPLPSLDGVSPSDLLLHRALVILETQLDAVGRSNAYGGFWSQPSSASVSVVLWVEHPDTRLCALSQLQLGASDFSVSLSHAVLWRQPWMTEHELDDFGWADMATNYLTHVDVGGTYWEAMASWKKGDRLWQNTRFGVDFNSAQGAPVIMSQRFQSFYNFHVGEAPFPAGTPVGQDLQRISKCLAETAQAWAGETGSSHRQGHPFGHRHGSIRQRED